MAPRHVLPFRAVGIVLEIEVPHTVLVKHTVRIVHPAVDGSMVINRTIFFLTVCEIRIVGQMNAFPACILLSFSHRTAALRSHNVENHLMPLVGRKIERNRIIRFRAGKPHVDGLGHIAVHKNIDSGIVGRLLHGKYHILFRAVCPHERVADPEMLYAHPIGGAGGSRNCDGPENRRCGDIALYSFHPFCVCVLRLTEPGQSFLPQKLYLLFAFAKLLYYLPGRYQ